MKQARGKGDKGPGFQEVGVSVSGGCDSTCFMLVFKGLGRCKHSSYGLVFKGRGAEFRGRENLFLKGGL